MLRSTSRALAALALTGTLAITACGGGSEDTAAESGGTVTMWARAATSSQSQALVDAYNASHETQVQLTVVPTDNYLQKVGVAAGSQDLPCLLASDVVYAPDFISKNLFQDLTDRIDALPFAGDLAPAHMEQGTVDGAKHVLPHTIGMSAVFQNDVLLQRAGIDPAAPVTTLRQLAENATKVAALGPDVTGLYFTGNNGGSIAFTHFPTVWASGGEILSEDGESATLDDPQTAAAFQVFNDLFKAGVVPDSARNETGATRNEVFAGGNVGYMLASNSVLETVDETDQLKIGVQGIPGVDGGVSTFVGGDVIGISSSCEQADAAWDFLEWSVGDQAQVQVYAKAHQLTVRTDLATNEFSAEDPRVQMLNELVAQGQTPSSTKFGQTFNDPQGPWLAVARDALFGDAPAAQSLAAGQNSVTESLAP
ncbi:ABC transporter substrate-binding protein [Kineococcus sp. SYSU DK006]|uniref:ABC transporter substrate-binding protein n=1 Tax=Kineococcus sp. SYSU DK006 TaxID=3383127 RepID=UPI003D7EE4C2